METIYGLKAKEDQYITRVFETACEYYNYEFIKTDKNVLEEGERIYKEKELAKAKFYYIKEEEIGAFALGFKTSLIDAEMISMAYRILEEMAVPNLTVKINTSDHSLLDYLDYLDIDYEVNNDIKENDTSLTFELISMTENQEQVIGSGKKDIKKNITSFSINKENLRNVLEEVANFKETKSIDVYITSTTLEETLTAIRLIQDLRWSEIITEMDYQNRSLEEQLEEASTLNARMVIKLNSEDLKKGLITVEDYLTKEETKVDENEILDYIISNL